MKQLRQLVREINQEKNLEENVLKYATTLSELYHQISLVLLTMDYVTLYERLEEKQGETGGYVSDAIQTINDIVGKVFCKGLEAGEVQSLLKEIQITRSEIINKMKVLTTYTDKLEIYEHVLNRMELKYQDTFALTEEDTFAEKVLQFIFGAKDNMIINERIKEVIGQLPVRMARTKYFQLIENSISLYAGVEKSTLERYIYMLETSAMLYEPEGISEYFLDIKDFVEKLEQVDFGELTEETYQSLCAQLVEKAAYIMDIADLYMDIQGILNYLYVYLLSCVQGTQVIQKEFLACKEVLEGVHGLFQKGNWEELSKEIEDKLILTEGTQEELAEKMMHLESILFDLTIGHKDMIEKLNQVEAFENLEKMQQLLSLSATFIELEERKEDKIVEQADIEEEVKKILEKLTAQFKEKPMCVNRAIIANTISKFPVFFTSSEEVMEYVKGALRSCQDAAERQACINILEELMAEQD